MLNFKSGGLESGNDISTRRHAVRQLADQHPTGQVGDLIGRRLSKWGVDPPAGGQHDGNFIMSWLR